MLGLYIDSNNLLVISASSATDTNGSTNGMATIPIRIYGIKQEITEVITTKYQGLA